MAESNELTVVGQGLIKPAQQLAVRRAEQEEAEYVPHLNHDQVKILADAAGRAGKGHYADRDRLLILTIFDGALRCSEAIGLRANDLQRDENGWSLRILGKGKKPGQVAISASLAAQLQAYCYREQFKPDDLVFPFTRSRAFQVISRAFNVSGLWKPSKKKDRVGCVHILRHSGAIERLKRTGNPKAVQDQLRHKSARMTLRYLKTVPADESLRIQQGVDFGY